MFQDRHVRRLLRRRKFERSEQATRACISCAKSYRYENGLF